MKKSNAKTPKICKHLDKFGNRVSNTPWKNSNLKFVFSNMKSRCYNENDKCYKFYGKKGIKICSKWLCNPREFEMWALNNGYEQHLSIDRIDANLDYSPENCRWISLSENTRRAGKVNWITVNDLTLTGKQWSKRLNVGTNYINRKIRKDGFDKTTEFIKNELDKEKS